MQAAQPPQAGPQQPVDPDEKARRGTWWSSACGGLPGRVIASAGQGHRSAACRRSITTPQARKWHQLNHKRYADKRRFGYVQAEKEQMPPGERGWTQAPRCWRAVAAAVAVAGTCPAACRCSLVRLLIKPASALLVLQSTCASSSATTATCPPASTGPQQRLLLACGLRLARKNCAGLPSFLCDGRKAEELQRAKWLDVDVNCNVGLLCLLVTCCPPVLRSHAQARQACLPGSAQVCAARDLQAAGEHAYALGTGAQQLGCMQQQQRAEGSAATLAMLWSAACVALH